MIRMLLAAFALLFALPAIAQTAPDARAAIEVGMKDSAEGWNSGDVDRFLAIYSDDPATSFTGSDGIAGAPELRRPDRCSGMPPRPVRERACAPRRRERAPRPRAHTRVDR